MSSGIKPVNQPDWDKWTSGPRKGLLLKQEEFNRLLKNNNEELAKYLYHSLTREESPLQKTQVRRGLARQIISAYDSKQKAQLDVLLSLLPEEIRSSLLDDVRRSGRGDVADSLNAILLAPKIRAEQKKLLSRLDSNKNGILDAGDKAFNQYAHLDLNGDGYLNYYELSRTESRQLSGQSRELFFYSISRRARMGIVTLAEADMLAKLAKEGNKEAAAYLAHVRATYYIKRGQYRKALETYINAAGRNNPHLKKIYVYEKLVKYEKALPLLEELSAVLPGLLKDKRALPGLSKHQREILSNTKDFANFADMLLRDSGILTASNVRAILAHLPRQAQSLRQKLQGFLKQAGKIKSWKISLDSGRPMVISLTNLGEKIVIIAPKPGGTSDYSVKLKVGKFDMPTHLDTKIEPHQDNPLFVRITIPMWRILKAIPPKLPFKLVVLSGYQEEKVSKSYTLERTDSKLPSIPMSTQKQYYAEIAAGLEQGKGTDAKPLQASYVVVSHQDHPEVKIHDDKHRNKLLRGMLAALDYLPASLLGLPEEKDKAGVRSLLSRALKGENVKIPPAVFLRLTAFQDLYFMKAYSALKTSGWKLISKEVKEPGPNEFKTDESTDRPYVISSRVRLTFERRVSRREAKGDLLAAMQKTGREEAVYRINVYYYTDTIAGYKRVFQEAGNESNKIATIQGHRLISERFKELTKQKGNISRRDVVAYFGNHCTSELITNGMLEAAEKVFAPVATADSIFPSAAVNVGFLEGMMTGEGFNLQMAAQKYDRATNRNKGRHAYINPRPHAYTISKDQDRDGLPQGIDPDDSKYNSLEYDELEENLNISRNSGRSTTLRGVTSQDDISPQS